MIYLRALPVIVEAVQWTGNLHDLPDAWREAVYMDDSGLLIVRTPNGPSRCPFGHYVVRGTEGEFYTISNTVRAAKYEQVQVVPS